MTRSHNQDAFVAAPRAVGEGLADARPAIKAASLLKLKLALLAPLAGIALLAYPADGYAQAEARGGITGRVLNSDTGSYLNNARVRVSGTNIETFTNEFGEFRLNDLPAGSVSLDVFYTGFPVKSVTVAVTGGTVAEQTISVAGLENLDDGVVQLEEFLVQSKRETNAQALALNEQRFSANLKNVVSTDAFGDVGQGNIGEFLKHVPGVTVEYGGAGTVTGVQIRGFNSNYTSVTLDGGAMASAAGTGTANHSRQFGLEQASINNLSRIEVVKLPTPENSANSMGGSVNMVSKNAFEKVRPELLFSTYLSMNSYDTQLEKTAGPEDEKSYKVRPSFDMSYTLPINKQFGLVVTASSANQFSRNYAATPSRTYITSGPSSARVLTGVYTSQVAVSDTPSLSDRDSVGLRLDWKPADGHSLSLTGQASAFSGFSGRRGLTLNPGGNPVAYGESFTYGAVNAGTVSQGTGYQDRNGLTHVVGLRYQFARGPWQADASAGVSTSTNKTRDTDKGFFNTVGTRTPSGTVKVDISGIHNGEGAASLYSVTDSLGNPVDFTKLVNSRITQATSERIDAEDTVKDFKVNVRRDLDFLPFNLALKGGANIYSLRREIDFTSKTWTYVGPDGVANTADDTAGAYVDVDYSVNTPGYTYPAVEWVSPWKVYQAFLDNPQYFTRSAGQINDTIRNEAVRSPILEETITSGYIMGDLKMLNNRVRLLGGVRYELTEDEGLGYQQTTTGYAKRGFFDSRDYDGFYPSVHGTVNITENLLFRAAFAKTMGRPPISDIVPNIYVAANTGTSGAPGWVVASNSTLEPWSAKNYDLALEYYLPFNGVASAGVFRKNVRNQFGSLTTLVDEDLAAELGLGSETIGYEYSTRINDRDSRITGAEFGYSQSLAVLGSWAKPFSVFSNFTVVDVDGRAQGDFKDFVPKSANLGGSVSYKRVYFLAKANYRGRSLRETKNSTFLGAGEFIRERTLIDLNLDVRLTKHFALFTTVRNLTNEPYQTEFAGPNLPEWATLTQDSRSGAQYTLGVKGNF
jgi:iron complex outermembrane receptor protein